MSSLDLCVSFHIVGGSQTPCLAKNSLDSQSRDPLDLLPLVLHVIRTDKITPLEGTKKRSCLSSSECTAFHFVIHVLPCQQEILRLAYPRRHCDYVYHPLNVGCQGEGWMEFISMPCSGIYLAFFSTLRESRYVPVHTQPVFLLDFHEHSPSSPVPSPFGVMKLNLNPAFLFHSSDYPYQ